jgi:hypothetical protein
MVKETLGTGDTIEIMPLFILLLLWKDYIAFSSSSTYAHEARKGILWKLSLVWFLINMSKKKNK